MFRRRSIATIAERVTGAGTQQRRHPRVDACDAIRVRAFLADGPREYSGFLLNLSVGGCAVQLGAKLDVETLVAFEVEVCGTLVGVRGHVSRLDANRRGWTHGIRFDSLDAQRAATVAQVVSDLQRRRVL